MDRFEEYLKAFIKEDQIEIEHDDAVHGNDQTFMAQARKFRIESVKRILSKYKEIRDEK